MTFKDIRIWSRLLTFTQIAGRLFLCLNIANNRVAYFYLSVMCLKAFNVGTSNVKIINWKYAIQAYKRYKTPRRVFEN